jgi:hypothetical protein
LNGLLLCRDFLIVSPELKPIEKPKYKIYSVAQKRWSAETAADKRTKADVAICLPA